MADPVFTNINWTPNMEITSDDLNAMVDNDSYLNNVKLAGKIRNVDPETGEIVPGSEVIADSLVTCGGYLEFSPPDQFDPDNPDRSSADRFTLDVNFPQGLFNPAYQPVVVPVLGSHQGSLEWVQCVIKFVTAEMFELTILKSISFDFSTDQKFFITWIAMGVGGGLL